MNYTTGGNAFALAKPTDHLHHFVYKSGRQQGSQMAEEVTEKGQVVETYHYQCSHLSCSAMVSLRIMSPLITLHRLELLSNPDLIRERAEEAIAAQPERLEGMAIPAPVTVLDNLRLYLHNALYTHERSKAISSANKRFMLSFGLEGTACKDVLEFLGFSYDAVGTSLISFTLPISLNVPIGSWELAATVPQPLDSEALPGRRAGLPRRHHPRTTLLVTSETRFRKKRCQLPRTSPLVNK